MKNLWGCKCRDAHYGATLKYSSVISVLISLSSVQTANLDGETNLKIRKGLERTWDLIDAKHASEFSGELAFSLSIFALSCCHRWHQS